jgi:hypothetical protein
VAARAAGGRGANPVRASYNDDMGERHVVIYGKDT